MVRCFGLRKCCNMMMHLVIAVSISALTAATLEEVALWRRRSEDCACTRRKCPSFYFMSVFSIIDVVVAMREQKRAAPATEEAKSLSC